VESGCRELRCRVEERVAVVTLDRPEAKNALTLEMKQALAELLPRLAADAAVGAVLLTGAGAAFCAGGDTKRMAREGAPPAPEERKRQLRWEHGIAWRSQRSPRCPARPRAPASPSRSRATCA
jgi:enoyl-CoA hydratase/carnithine racemase